MPLSLNSFSAVINSLDFLDLFPDLEDGDSEDCPAVIQ